MMKRNTMNSAAVVRILFFLLAAVLAGGCAGHQPLSGQADARGPVCPLPTPATFTGTVPCTEAACARIRLTLNLRPDAIYQLRKTWIDKNGGVRKTLTGMGRWRYVADGNLIVLGRKKDMLNVLSIQGLDRLRLLDVRGRKIISRLPYELTRAGQLDPFPDTVRMRGMYRKVDGGALFSECLSGVTFPVADGRAGEILEQTYTQTPHGQEEPLLAVLEGGLVQRPGRGGLGSVWMVRVDRFERFIPDADCTGVRTGISLTRTNWRLIEVAGKAVTIAQGQQEPFFVLEPDGRQRGFSGCNRFFGTYLVRGDVLVFNKMAATRMACRRGMEVEDAFLKALSATESYLIKDDVLELRDRKGTVLARLRAAGRAGD